MNDPVDAFARTIYHAVKAFRSLQAAYQHVKGMLTAGNSLWAIVASVLF